MRHLRRKLTLRAHNEQVVFVKRAQERIEHVWMKAFLWALYLPAFPDLTVELDIGEKYKPDVVAMDERRGRPRFWGEAGHVDSDKITYLVQRQVDTHIAIAKWDTDLDPTLGMVENAVHEVQRTAPIDLIRFPPDSDEQFLDHKGRIRLSWSTLTWVRIGKADAFE